MARFLRSLCVVFACFLSLCVSADEVSFSLSSKSVEFSDVDLVAQEVSRDGRISRVEFIDNDPNQGDILAKDFFRLRSLSTLAQQRGFRYFMVLDTDGIKAHVIGLLKSKTENLAEVLGDVHKNLPVDSIIDIEYVKPFVVEHKQIEKSQ